VKITFVTYIYPYPDRGYNPGIERVVQELARELVRQGHEVHVLTTYRNGGVKSYERDEGVHLHRISDTRHYLGRVGSLFSLDLLSLNYSITAHSDLLESSDVVHAFSPIVWKFFSTPLVAHYHHWDDPDEPLEYLYLPTSHRLWMRCYDVADRVIAVSEYSADDLSSRGINRKNIDVIYNGVDNEVYHPGESSIEIEEWNNILLYVGPLMERKGIDYLIKAMPQILKEHSGVGLVILGDGEKEWLENLAKELGVRKNIRFEGFVPEDDLPEYYKAADIFVFPSLLEGFGMVLVEAMASGLPIVSTTATAIPEVVGDAGCLVPSRDSRRLSHEISRLLSDPELLEYYGGRGERRAQKWFTWTAVTQTLINTYKSLIPDQKEESEG